MTPTLRHATPEMYQQSKSTTTASGKSELIATYFIKNSGRSIASGIAAPIKLLNFDESDIATAQRITARL